MSHRHVSSAEPQFTAQAVVPARQAATEDGKLIVEDGWVFREHHGKYVECVCRSDEMPSLGQAKS